VQSVRGDGVPVLLKAAGAAGRVSGAPGVSGQSPVAARGPNPLVRPLWILAVCALVLALREWRQALVPVMLAILLALVLSGVVEALRRVRVPRGLSAVVLLIIGGSALGGAMDALWTPAQQWVQSAPQVLRVIERKVRPARAVMLRLNELATRASSIAGPTAAAAAPVNSASTPTPLSALELLSETGWLAGASVTVAVLTLLLLSAGPPTLARMTAALGGNWHAVQVLRTIDAIRVEMGRYYGTLALVNLSLGAATAVTMWLMHMPNPLLWGAMAAALNFIPYLGSAVTLLVISVVALVTFDSVPHALLVAASYLGLATLEGQIVEPIFFGRRLQLNPIVVFLGLWLGGWLWGVAGVVFAMPVLITTKVAAERCGARVVLRFLGPASNTLEENEVPRLHVPGVLRGPGLSH
jgi:predicted PurR-regulated permease PerM